MASSNVTGGEEGSIPIILDYGSSGYRAGLSGEDTPKIIKKFPAESAPIKRGRIVNLNRLGDYFQEALQLTGYVDSPILFTEPPLAYRSDREWITQQAFEVYSAPAIYFANQATLSLYAIGKTTGLVVDIGHGVSRSTPVFEGKCYDPGSLKIELGGQDLSEYLRHITGKTYSQCELLKEKFCEVSLTPVESLAPEHSTFTLPDGQEITLGLERYKCPEILFDPSFLSTKEGEFLPVHRLTYQTLQSLLPEFRRDMYANVVLVGGSTMFPNFEERFKKELSVLAPSTHKVSTFTAPEGGSLASWLGGSIMTSLTAFSKMWITQQEYNEHGPTIANRKCT